MSGGVSSGGCEDSLERGIVWYIDHQESAIADSVVRMEDHESRRVFVDSRNCGCHAGQHVWSSDVEE